MKLTNFSDFVEQEMLNMQFDLENKDKVIDYIVRLMKSIATGINKRNKQGMVALNPSDADIVAIIKHLKETNDFEMLIKIENIDDLASNSELISKAYKKAPEAKKELNKEVVIKRDAAPSIEDVQTITKPKKPKKLKADQHKASVESVFGNWSGEEANLF